MSVPLHLHFLPLHLLPRCLHHPRHHPEPSDASFGVSTDCRVAADIVSQDTSDLVTCSQLLISGC